MASTPTATNLLFHIVVPGDGVAAGPLGAVTQGGLRRRLASMLGAGLVPASLGDYATGRPPGAGAFTVSFDDAHPSVPELAAPVLGELGIPGAVFVPPSHVGQTPCVSGWPALRDLARRGWTIGSHALVHERLGWRHYDEDEEAWLGRVGRSASNSRHAIEREIGTPVDLFAWPFGEAPRAARHAVREAGYAAAFSVDGSTSWDGDVMAIPRLDGCPEPASADETPGISVIVPACDRSGVLREVVRRLAEQSYPEDRREVIVVDDGSRDDIAAALRPWLSAGVRVARLPGSDTTFRAGQARQHGAALAGFPVLAFLDADVAVDRDFLWHLAWVHGRHPRAVVLGYLSGYNLHDLGFRHEVADVAAADRLDGGAVPVIPDRSREPQLQACLDNLDLLEAPWTLGYTGNLSLRRELLSEAGGFAQGFDGWGFEDVDLAVRLHDAGVRWVFSRFALGYHLADPEEDGGQAIPRNPFRRPRPEREAFAGVLRNLDRLRERHPGHEGVTAFAAQVVGDVEEICSRPRTVGVRAEGPGGFPLHAILDRVSYARSVGAREIYLLGTEVALRRDLESICAAATLAGLAVTIELEAGLAGRPDVEGRLAGLGIGVRVV